MLRREQGWLRVHMHSGCSNLVVGPRARQATHRWKAARRVDCTNEGASGSRPAPSRAARTADPHRGGRDNRRVAACSQPQETGRCLHHNECDEPGTREAVHACFTTPQGSVRVAVGGVSRPAGVSGVSGPARGAMHLVSAAADPTVAFGQFEPFRSSSSRTKAHASSSYSRRWHGDEGER